MEPLNKIRVKGVSESYQFMRANHFISRKEYQKKNNLDVATENIYLSL
jgi:hypothetical protein